MEENMKVIGKITEHVEKVNLLIEMVTLMKDNGIMIKLTV
jgi:hypothetical protein